jgi:hypothetical protein
MSKDEVDSAITALEAWGRFEDNWVLICAAGVALFLALEVIFSVAHWRNERTLRPLRAEQSRLHATELAELGRTAEEAKKETARLSAEADAAKAEIAKANENAAKAIERAAVLEQETTRLKIAAAWRRISKEQHDIIVSALSGQTSELGVYGIRAENDGEANALWQDIVMVLRDTDLKLTPATILASGQGVSVTPVQGPELDALRQAFSKAGIVLFDANGEFAKHQKLELLVGSKLPPN